MIFGKGTAVFKIYDATPTLLETITITYVNGRDNQTPETRDFFEYKNPFTRTKTEKFLGYYVDDVLTVTAPDYPVSKDIDDYYIDQSNSTTENDVSKALRIATYYDQGFTIRYIRHSDTETSPYNFYWNVRARVMNLSHPNVYADSCQLHLEGFDLYDTLFAITVTEPQDLGATLAISLSNGTPAQTAIAVDITGATELGGVAVTGHLVVRRKASAVTFDPVDNTIYTVGQDLGSDQFVVYSDIGATDFEDTGLTEGTTYHYEIWPYNGFGGFKNYGTVSDTASHMTAFTP